MSTFHVVKPSLTFTNLVRKELELYQWIKGYVVTFDQSPAEPVHLMLRHEIENKGAKPEVFMLPVIFLEEEAAREVGKEVEKMSSLPMKEPVPELVLASQSLGIAFRFNAFDPTNAKSWGQMKAHAFLRDAAKIRQELKKEVSPFFAFV